MKKIAVLTALIPSFIFAQFEGELIKEFGVKVSYTKVNYDSIGTGDESETLDETISAYGYLASETPSGFVAGASLEVISGSKVSSGRNIVYTAIELNPQVEYSFGETLRLYTGFGGSINRFKESAGNIDNKDINLGLQFLFGAKYSIYETFGVLGEYKVKLFMTGDYSNDVLHHFSVGIFFLFR